MKERPILFNGEMVRAILDGRKTQTRRVIKIQSTTTERPYLRPDGLWTYTVCDGVAAVNPFACHYGIPGDRLWVRETLSKSANDTLIYDADGAPVMYGGESEKTNIKKKIPSIHLPRWASRINLEITNIRVERVQDISVIDCACEGIEFAENDYSENARYKYHMLWDSINLKRGYGWDANPWVWVIEFRRMP